MLAQGFEIVFQADHHLRQRIQPSRVHESGKVVTLQVRQQSIYYGYCSLLTE